jgi:hypothetical protein
MNTELISYQSLLEFENKFKLLERKILVYIYQKYIKEKKDTLEKGNTLEKKEKKDTLEKEFINSILKPRKPRLISQDSIIRKDIKAIIMASDAYQDTPEDYPSGLTEYGYPDSLRCNHIIWRKNNFHRCQKKVFETDDSMDYCKCHQDMDNPYDTDYRKNYLEVYKEMKKQGEIDSE